MKKILIITLLIFIVTPNYTYATGACLIKDKSAEVLLGYIKDSRKIVENVTNSIVKNKNIKKENTDNGFIQNKIDGIKRDYNNAKNESISVFNEIFNFSGFFSYFEYFVTHSISKEVPYEVERDYELLDNEFIELITYLKKIDKKGDTKIIVENACSGILKKCELDGMTTKDVIGKLIQNNDKILDLFRLTIIGKTTDFSSEGLFLVDNNFELEVNKNYGIEAVSSCNSSEGGFYDQVEIAVDNIKILNKLGETGIQDWKDAWGLIIGKKPSKEKIVEKESLRGYLSDIGVQMGNQDIMVGTSSRYNQEGISMNNTFIGNTMGTAFTKINNELGEWKDNIVTSFFEDKDDEYTVLNDVGKVADNSRISIDLKENISKIYNKELPYAAIGDITTEKLRAKIIETHMSLDDSINTLEKTIKISQKVCKSQNKGAGICE